MRTPLRACKTRCRSEASRAAAAGAVLVLLALAKRIMMERCAMARATLTKNDRRCLSPSVSLTLERLGLIGRSELYSPMSWLLDV